VEGHLIRAGENCPGVEPASAHIGWEKMPTPELLFGRPDSKVKTTFAAEDCKCGFQAGSVLNKADVKTCRIQIMRSESLIIRGLALLLAFQFAHPAFAEDDIRRDAIVQAVAKVRPSVVNISTGRLVEVYADPFEELFREFFGHHRRAPDVRTMPYSLGSGVIVDEEGYILTNDHVVRRADVIVVRLGDRDYQAKVEATSPASDIALIKIEPENGQKFSAVQFAKDEDLLLGETVIALGNPFGLGLSVSRGILSSTARRPQPEKELLEQEDWLQTDAAVNPGNSGGPLVNLRGELIGLNNAVYRQNMAQGISFAIPIKRVGEALSEMFTPENKGFWFGARIKSTESVLSVISVQSGSPAEKAGIRAGDTILRVGDKAPKNFIQFMVELIKRAQQKDVALTISRNGEQKKVTARIVPEDTVFNAELIRQKTGATMQAITPDVAEVLGVRPNIGLVIAAVDKNTPAAVSGLQPGIIVTAIDGEPANDITAAAKKLFEKRKGESVSLIVEILQRQGNMLYSRPARVDLKIRQ
jgi:serine protease Do